MYSITSQGSVSRHCGLLFGFFGTCSNMFYLIKYIQNIVSLILISIRIIDEIFCIHFSFRTKSLQSTLCIPLGNRGVSVTSQLGPAMFQVLSGHMGLGAAPQGPSLPTAQSSPAALPHQSPVCLPSSPLWCPRSTYSRARQGLTLDGAWPRAGAW